MSVHLLLSCGAPSAYPNNQARHVRRILYDQRGGTTCDLPHRPPVCHSVTAKTTVWLPTVSSSSSAHAGDFTAAKLTSALPSDILRYPLISLAAMSTVTRAYLDQRLALAKRCSREAAMAGAKAAAVATVAAAVPTLASVRMLPWAKAHLNPAGQALIISTVAGMAYFIVADKTILSMARKHSFEDAPDHLKNTSFQ
ncbi:uncharacterized protein LOC124703617 [Lolium rigidum]|uniref:uncharacterized protein LOC124703617 n=1 Tax=Lolium rigidum TaxID=89674 RepID=UPI001F5D17BF|nr:uncharacterized protein LOC124703617 [Lolium rigidum]